MTKTILDGRLLIMMELIFPLPQCIDVFIYYMNFVERRNIILKTHSTLMLTSNYMEDKIIIAAVIIKGDPRRKWRGVLVERKKMWSLSAKKNSWIATSNQVSTPHVSHVGNLHPIKWNTKDYYKPHHVALLRALFNLIAFAVMGISMSSFRC